MSLEVGEKIVEGRRVQVLRLWLDRKVVFSYRRKKDEWIGSMTLMSKVNGQIGCR